MQKKKTGKAVAIIAVLLVIVSIASVGVVVFTNRYYPLRHVDIIRRHAAEFNLEPELVCAVIHAESRFRENAVSRAGASGLMQIMEDTANWIAPSSGLDDFDYGQILDPEINIRLGSYYLSSLLAQFGNLEAALSAYNAGRGNVDRWLGNPEYSSDGKTLDRIPFAETSEYVRRVLDNQRIYAFLLRHERIFSR